MIPTSSPSAMATPYVAPILSVVDTTVVPNSIPSNSSHSVNNPQNTPQMFTTRQIKEIESKLLYDYVHAMPYVDRKYFITKVVDECKVPRRHFYNWQDGYSRIPTYDKKIIESIVGYTMFEATIGM
mgnify:FL=1